MRGVFDTHTFLWWDASRAKLSDTARNFCDNPQNQLYISVVTIWEIQIKTQLGKLELARPLEELIRDEEANGIKILPITREHVYALAPLPMIHRDPFDRILIAQANYEGAVLLTKDPIIPLYPIQTLW